MPEGHLPVRSYLAVPVITSDGGVAGGLFFGHPEPGMFSLEDERMVEGIAAQSAIAIENARLYQERTRTAQTLQRALLPPHLPQIAGARHWPRATAPPARATRSAATSTTSSSRATAAGCWSSATSAARARRPPP